MRIKILTDNLELTSRVRKLVNEKVGIGLTKHMPRLNEEIKTAEMRITKHKRWGYKINFDMRLPENYQIYAEEKHERLSSALASLRDELIRQVKTYKSDLKQNQSKIRKKKRAINTNRKEDN